MKKTKLTRSLLAACSIVALSAVMYGCVHSGDDSAESGMEMPMPDPEPMQTPAEQLAAANQALEDARTLVAALMSSSTAEEASAAYAALGAAQAAVHAATSLPQNQIDALQDQVDTLTMNLNTANTLFMQGRSIAAALATATTAVDGLTDESTDADVTAARTAVAAAQAAIAAATDLLQADSDALGALIGSLDSRLSGIETARAEPGPNPAVTKAAGTKEKAIAAEAAQMIAAGLGGTGATTYSMTIERPRSGTTIEIDDTANAEDDDPKFMQAMDLGGGRTMHVRTMEADDDGNVVEEVVIVSTDIEAPTATAFAKVEGQALDANPDDDSVNQSLLVTPTNSALIMSSAFTAGTAAVLTFDNDASATGDEDEAFETAGTYNGAMGTYRCDGGAVCTVDIDAMGAVSSVGNGWIFTPATGATSDVPDADYLHYGFWLKKTTDADGVLTYNEVETFADSPLVAASTGTDVDDVEGSASYEGGATGVYVKSETNSDGTRASATSGHFTADASLMAYFGGDDVAVSMQNTVTGSISNFDLSGGEENAWSVALKGTRAERANAISGTANGGGAEGMFSGTFHGPTDEYDHDDDATTDEIRRQPHTVVGEFGANFSNGSVAGAFGARKQ